MFREEYKKSFDNISPSAELLDRISAMMSEEAAKKKPPIRMQAVKYGGIAAALAIAAGGTFAVTQMTRNNIMTESANYAAPAAMEKSASVVETAGDTAEAESYDLDGVSMNSADNGNYATENSLIISAEGTAPVTAAAADAAEETRPTETTSAVTTKGFLDIAGIVNKNEDNENSFFVNAADSVMGDYSCDDSDDDVSPTMGSPEVAEECADAATGLSDTDALLDPFGYSFTQIPDELKKLAGVYNDDGSYSERWTKYIYGIQGLEVPDNDKDAEPTSTIEASVEAESVGGCINVWSFIRFFNISVDDARKALIDEGNLTEEQIETVLTADEKAVTAAFASPESIVKGEKVYTPLWLLRHSYEDYKAAGITKDDILAKYDLLTSMSDRYSDAVIDSETQKELTEKLDSFLTAQ